MEVKLPPPLNDVERYTLAANDVLADHDWEEEEVLSGERPTHEQRGTEPFATGDAYGSKIRVYQRRPIGTLNGITTVIEVKTTLDGGRQVTDECRMSVGRESYTVPNHISFYELLRHFAAVVEVSSK